MTIMVFFNFLFVFLIGAIWSFLEIIVSYDLKYVSGHKKKRNRPEPQNSVIIDEEESAWGYIACYLLLNGVISMISLLLLKYSAKETICDITSIEISNVLIAGLGGVILLRSSVFSYFNDNKEVGVGFMSIVHSLLDKIDKKIKHNIAAKRICEIYDIMKDVDYERAKEELPYLCIKYIDSFSEKDSKELINAIKDINGNLSDVNKSLQLGREIAKYCDVEILKRAVKKLPIRSSTEQPDVEKVQINDEFETRKEQLYKK